MLQRGNASPATTKQKFTTKLHLKEEPNEQDTITNHSFQVTIIMPYSQGSLILSKENGHEPINYPSIRTAAIGSVSNNFPITYLREKYLSSSNIYRYFFPSKQK